MPKGYYNLNDASTKAWFKTTLNVDIDAGEIPHLFEKRSILMVEEYGQYKAEARNRIFNSLTKASSNVATFNTPDSVVMDNKNQTADKHIIGTESAVLSPVVVEAIGDLSYEWLKASEDDANIFEPIDESVAGAKDNVLIATEPGTYKLKVTRTRNRATTNGTSIEYRVTNAPEAPEFVDGTYEALEIISVNDLLAGTKILSVEWKDNVESDEFYVSWYLYRGDKEADDLNIVTHKISNAFKSEFNPADVTYIPIFEAAGEDIEGSYYAIVKNKLNGVESSYNEKPEQDKMFFVTGS